MSDPLNPPDPGGDLSLFGASEKPVSPADEIPEVVEEASAPAAEPEPTPETPEPSVEETQPAEEDLVQAALAAEKPSEESEVTKLRQEVARLEGAMQARMDAYKEQLQPPVQEPEETDVFNDPAVQGVLRDVRENNPEQYETTLIRIAQQSMQDKLDKDRAEREAAEASRAQQQQMSEQATRIQAGVRDSLSKIKSEGGIAAQIVDDFESRKNESFLWKKFEANQALVLAGEDGIRAAVSGIERELRERQPSVQESVTPSIEASAGVGAASNRGVQLGAKPNEKSEEDKIADDMFDVGSRSSKISFL